MISEVNKQTYVVNEDEKISLSNCPFFKQFSFVDINLEMFLRDLVKRFMIFKAVLMSNSFLYEYEDISWNIVKIYFRGLGVGWVM